MLFEQIIIALANQVLFSFSKCFGDGVIHIGKSPFSVFYKYEAWNCINYILIKREIGVRASKCDCFAIAITLGHTTCANRTV